jgi:hypothetical protein
MRDDRTEFPKERRDDEHAFSHSGLMGVLPGT